MSRAQKYLIALKKSGFNLSITDFTQALGAELLTNGDFASWTGDNPNSWTVVGESGADPEVSEVASNEGHGGVGTGAANMFSSATNNQPRIAQTVLTVGSIYEVVFNVTNFVSGNIAVLGGVVPTANNFASTGIRRIPARGTATTFTLGGGTAPNDVTVDDASIKAITLNDAQVAVANGTFDLFFALPVSPVANEEIHLLYRMSAAADELLNGWDCYLRRNAGNTAWDIRLDRIITGTRTNVIAISSVGTPTGIRAIANGDSHTVFTFASGVWTQRGILINSASFNTSTRVNSVYSSTFTPSLLQITG